MNLLYSQNVAGLGAFLIFGPTYLIMSWGIIPVSALFVGTAVSVVTLVLRGIGTWRWHRAREKIRTRRQLRPWLGFIQAMLFCSGVVWGAIGWASVDSPSLAHEILSVALLIFMSAGAVVCYAAYRSSMALVAAPALVPWTLRLLIADEPALFIVGLCTLAYLVLALRVGRNLCDYVLGSIRLNLENKRLAEDLEEQVFMKEQVQEGLIQSEERLRMALEFAGAATWCWQRDQDRMVFEGSLRASLGLVASSFQGSLEEFLHVVHPEDRAAVREGLMESFQRGVRLDREVRTLWPDGTLHFVALAGQLESPAGGTPRMIGLCWDITAKKNEEQLRRDKEIYEEANRAKSVFLANASHEIRTPLAAINGFAEALLQQEEFSNDMREDLNVILRNGKFLVALVNDLLDLSKVETGRMAVHRTLLSPRVEIEESLRVVRSTLQSKGLNVRVEFLSILPDKIFSDATRFRQILINLLSNAAKFTAKGEVTIRSWFVPQGDGGQLVIRVSDTGIGLSPELAGRLFQPFVRGTSEDVQNTPGSGLGLALSRNLARLLGGDLKLVSSVEGTGSEFEMSVETGAVRDRIRPPDAMRREARPMGSSRLAGSTILVVDDASDLRSLVRRVLARHGAAVETATNGAEAVEKLREGPCDVVIMDIKMPGMDGYEATETIRRMGDHRPIIALTAHANANDRRRCLDVGCDDYLSKPIEIERLIEAIEHQLHRRRLGSAADFDVTL